MRKILGYSVLICGLLLGAALVAFPQSVTTLAGLAVAQSTNKWNKLKDMANGDAQANGVGLFSPCLYNGITCDRQRGTIADGSLTDNSELPATAALADATANPTLSKIQAFEMNLNAAGTWDRTKSANSDSQAATGLRGAGNMLWNEATGTWDRFRGPGPTQGGGPNGALFNSTTTGAANTAVVVTVTGAANQRIRSANVSAFCGAGGTATLTLADGATTKWVSPTLGVGATLFTANFAGTPFTASTGSNFVATLSACGVGITGTVNVQASRF